MKGTYGTNPSPSGSMVLADERRPVAGVPFVGLSLLVLAVGTDRLGVRLGALHLRFELIAGGLLAAWCLIRDGRKIRYRVGAIECCLIGWLAVAMASSLLFAPERDESVKSTVIIAGLLTIYGAGFLLLGTPRAVTWAAITWVITGTGVALLGLLAAMLYIRFGLTQGILLERFYRDGIFVVTPKVQSTMWEPNIFGSYSLTSGALAFALARAPAFRSPGWQRSLWFAIACAFCGATLSMTRTVWVLSVLLMALLAVTGLWLHLIGLRRLLIALIAPALLGAAVGIAVGQYMPSVSWSTQDPWSLTYPQVEHIVKSVITGSSPATTPTAPAPAADQPGPPPSEHSTSSPGRKGSALFDRLEELTAPMIPSLVSRERIYVNALEGWLQRPLLGWGAGSYQYRYPPPPEGGSWIGNVELHALFDTGLAGLALLAIAVGVAIMRGVRVLRSPSATWGSTQCIVFGLLNGGAGMALAYQMTDGTWLGFTWVFFAIFVAAGRCASAPHCREQQADTAVTAPCRPVIALPTQYPGAPGQYREAGTLHVVVTQRGDVPNPAAAKSGTHGAWT